MRPFTTVSSRALVLPVANVDTDVITPMKRMMERAEHPLSHYAFEPLRYRGGNADTGDPDPDFCLNRPEADGAEIMLVGDNFGCGSSRETAPAVIAELGIRCLIGTSFGDIFFNNCFQQGVLPIAVDEATVQRLAADGRVLTVDLQEQEIRTSDGERIRFACNPRRRRGLLTGLDDIALTLEVHRGHIERFQANDRDRRPWIHRR